MSTVLLTGATGLVGAHVLSTLLAQPQNLHVRIALRSRSQTAAFLEKYAAEQERLSFVYVPDITEEGAFDRAVEGIEYIIHTASPVNFSPKDVRKDVLEPAVNGTLSILKSAYEANCVKSFVVTSSVAAALDFRDIKGPGYSYSPKDNINITFEEAAALPLSEGMLIYASSKVLAEKAGFDYVKRNSPSFAFCVVAPVWVIGPSEKAGAKTPKEVGTSFYLTYTHIMEPPNFTPTEHGHAVDVRDVANVHVWAALKPEISAGKRYFVVPPQRWSNHHAANVLRRRFPEHKDEIVDVEDKMVPGESQYDIDGTLASKDFGFEYIPLDISIVDMASQIWKMKAEAAAAE